MRPNAIFELKRAELLHQLNIQQLGVVDRGGGNTAELQWVSSDGCATVHRALEDWLH